MFSRISLIFLLFVCSFVSSDNRVENKPQTGFNSFENKVLISLGVGVFGAGLSQRAIFLGPDAQYLDGFCMCADGSKLLRLSLFAANFKIIPLALGQVGTISFENAQRLCSLISVGHGFLAARLCQWGLNRFFPR